MATLVDALLEGVAAVLFAALGWVILSGLIRTHETSLLRNPLAYSTIAIFWASTIHRLTDVFYALRGERTVSWERVAIDGLVFVGLLGYWVVRFALRADLDGRRVELFRDRGAEKQARLERLRSALEINDEVVQGLTAALMSIELGESQEMTVASLQRTLESSRVIVSEILAELRSSKNRIDVGDLVVRKPAP